MTIFEKIISKEIPSRVAYEDDEMMAIHDINPQAPVHVLVIPKRAIPRIGEVQPADAPLLGRLLLTGAKIAAELGLAENGYRLVINNGRDGGETVPHLHVHVLGGRHMAWPPG
jgi:histidine triad (HIT) family protein